MSKKKNSTRLYFDRDVYLYRQNLVTTVNYQMKGDAPVSGQWFPVRRLNGSFVDVDLINYKIL